MAFFIVPNLSQSPTLLQYSKDKPIPTTIMHQTCTFSAASLPPSKSAANGFLALSKMEPSPIRVAQQQPQRRRQEVNQHAPPVSCVREDNQQQQRNDFYVNVGLAVRTLRQDLPLLFTKDLDYHIYREDITFADPLNTFTGIDKYKMIFWALRFHGRILFREISLEVLRVWQPCENVILIRWDLRGVPRVPWEAKGQFQGTSRYKMDRLGKIYHHQVDNLAFNFPLLHPLRLPSSALDLDLIAASPPTPTLTFFCCLWPPTDLYSSSSSSWVKFYEAVKESLDDHHQPSSVPQCCLLLLNCS